MEAKITLIGMETFLNKIGTGDSLFADLELPEDIDKDVFVENLMLTCGEFETLYANPNYMKRFVTNWGKKWYHTFSRWAETLKLEYNPIENYDRTEDTDETDTTTHSGTSDLTNSGKDTLTQTFNDVTDTYDGTTTDTPNNWQTQFTPSTTDTVSTNTTSEEVKRTTETDVSAYDSSSYEHSQKVTETVEPVTGAEGSTTTTTSHTGFDTTAQVGTYDVDTDYTSTKSGNIENETDFNSSHTRTDNLTDDRTYNRTSHIHGNIGITTNMALVSEELELRRFNIINEMTDLFATELLVLVY